MSTKKSIAAGSTVDHWLSKPAGQGRWVRRGSKLVFAGAVLATITGMSPNAASAQFDWDDSDWFDDDNIDWSDSGYGFGETTTDQSSQATTSSYSTDEDRAGDDISSIASPATTSSPTIASPTTSYDMFGDPHDSNADAQVADLIYEVVATKANVDLGIPTDGVVTYDLKDVPTGLYETSSGIAIIGTNDVDDIVIEEETVSIRTAATGDVTEYDIEENDRDRIIVAGNGGGDVIYGSRHDDTIVGTVLDDRIESGGNDDTVFAGPGDDEVIGRTGDDVIFGGAGDDQIYPGSGKDTVFAGAGDDLIDETQKVIDFVPLGWNDNLNGGIGNDTIRGGLGADSIQGGPGSDYIEGNQGKDVISGGYGNDVLYGGKGHDRISGDQGDDFVQAGKGTDVVFGGDGDDVIYGNKGQDTLNGNKGDDYVDGGSGNDVIRGQDGNDVLSAGLDDDELDGGAGSNTIIASAGYNKVSQSSLDRDGDIIYAGKWQDLVEVSDNDELVDVDFDEALAAGEVENLVEDPDVADRIASDLVTLRSIPAGQKVLGSIADAEQIVEIVDGQWYLPSFVEYDEELGESAYGFEGYEGTGIDSTIHMAPIRPLSEHRALPVVELGHELSHSDHLANGTVRYGEVPEIAPNGKPFVLENGDPMLVRSEEREAMAVENEILEDLNLPPANQYSIDTYYNSKGLHENRFFFRPPGDIGGESEEETDSSIPGAGNVNVGADSRENDNNSSDISRMKVNASTATANSARTPGPCSDSDGDGWGWDGSETCQMSTPKAVSSTVVTPNNEASSSSRYPRCDQGSGSDSDGDGYGWENNKTCLVD